MKKSLLRTNEGFAEMHSSNDTERGIKDIYERHVDTVYRVSFALMGNKQDAEDVTQSVFIKLLECGKTFADREHEKAWLITAARNQCRDMHRKWWRRKVIRLDQFPNHGENAGAARLADLEDKLRKLPPSSRLLLYLYYYEGYKLAEIGTMLNLNLNTVKTRIRTARKRLKLEMGDDVRE
jgi:RNA polymerase sigma-70 factor (ECF subfamily)